MLGLLPDIYRGIEQEKAGKYTNRGKRNEPAYTAHTAQMGAQVFGMEYAEFAAQTTANFDRLFTKAALFNKVAA